MPFKQRLEARLSIPYVVRSQRDSPADNDELATLKVAPPFPPTQLRDNMLVYPPSVVEDSRASVSQVSTIRSLASS